MGVKLLDSNVDQYVVGIDFGTTNSVIAEIKENKGRVLASIGSVVNISADGSISIGNGGENSLHIASIKRLLGKTFSEYESISHLFTPNLRVVSGSQGDLLIAVGDMLLSPVNIAGFILQHLKSLAEEASGRKIDLAVMTVPAYFDSNAKKGVLMASREAQIKVLRVIAEPTAAAYAYGLENKASGQYMVFDLGGGTFDVSILKMQQGVFRVLGVAGDNMLGGDDIDLILARYIESEAGHFDSSAFPNLKSIARSVKEELSYQESVLVKGASEFKNLRIDRNLFVFLIKDLIQKTMDLARSLYSSHPGVVLDGILLVGGSVKIPVFEHYLKDNFPNIPILKDVDPENIVALGAAWQAHNLSRKKDDLLIDVNPLSLGIELMGGLVEVLIPRNVPIPTHSTKIFTTHADGQTAIQFNVVQGERDLAKDCISLARFELKGLPSLRAGHAKVEVLFALDVNGLLSVTSTELSTGASQEVVVNASYGMSEERLILFLEESIDHAEEDFNVRRLLELKSKAKDLIRSVYKLYDDKTLKNDYSKALVDIKSLEEDLDTDDYEKIQTSFSRLEESSFDLFENALQQSIKSAIVGKKLDPIS